MKAIVDLSGIRFLPVNVNQCRETLKKTRWSAGFVCPVCGHNKAYQLKKRNLLECANKKCKRQTSPTAGTQFHNARPKSLENLWSILSEFRDDLNTLSKARISKLTKASAKTSSRIARIISSSFPLPPGLPRMAAELLCEKVRKQEQKESSPCKRVNLQIPIDNGVKALLEAFGRLLLLRVLSA
ncbi:MAG: transposase [Candidatus Obscuribacterales bacterium]|nr:transposase [Candidatus Obscuribacterales bacterium]